MGRKGKLDILGIVAETCITESARCPANIEDKTVDIVNFIISWCIVGIIAAVAFGFVARAGKRRERRRENFERLRRDSVFCRKQAD
jgi:hypothetical protein